MNESVRLGEIAGVRVGVNWSVFLIFALITTGLAAGRFPTLYPDLSAWAYILAGLTAGAVFFCSLLAHEISHTIVAQRNGVEVEGITLWLLGGMAVMHGDADDPRAAIRIAAIGPAVSAVLAGGFSGVAFTLQSMGLSGLLPGTFWWLALINVILAVFNLIPAGPLDGGRILRGVLWLRSGDRHRSSATAARAGRSFGWFLIVLGFLEFFAGIGVAGLWLALIGWFISTMARAEENQAEVSQLLDNVKVEDVMTPGPATVRTDTPVADLVDRVFTSRHSTFPVVTPDGRMAGLITLNRVKELPADQRTFTPVGDIACPPDDVATAGPHDNLIDLLAQMHDCSEGRAVVLGSNDSVIGIVSPRDVTHHIKVAELLSPRMAAR